MTTITATITQYVCERCGHRWTPRQNARPTTCPNRKCRSPYWDKPRQAPKAKEE